MATDPDQTTALPDLAAPLRQRLRAWWRGHFGTPPSWSFSFAHWSAAINRTTLAEERDKEQAQRKWIVQAWREGL